jgi:hypothetical protein
MLGCRTPGVFAVMMREQYLAGVRFNANQLIEKLAAEVAVKLCRKGKVGFVLLKGWRQIMDLPLSCQRQLSGLRGVIDPGPFWLTLAHNLNLAID